MARILLLALLVWIPVERCSGAALPETFEIDDSNSAENVEMDLMLMNDAEQSADASQDQLQERQFGLGFGGLGGFGLGYGGYGGLGLGYGGFGGGVCTRACFGIGCRVICRNRLFFDEDPEGLQDTELAQDPSLMEGSDEFQDPIFIDDSLLNNPVPENIKGLPLPPKEEKREKDHKKCAEKHVKDNIDLTRVPPNLSTTDRRRFEMMAGTDSSKWNTDARVQELIKAGYKVVVVPHHIFKRLRPNDIVLRRTVKNTMNPEDKDSSAIRKELVRRFMESSKTSSENVDPSLFLKHTSETNRINRIPTDSKRVDIPWSLMGSNRRRETIEEDNRLPLTNIGGATTNVENASHLEGGKFIRVPEESLMKKKHHRRPVIIIMDENQDPQVPQ